MGCITSKPHTKSPRSAALSRSSTPATMTFSSTCSCRPASVPSLQSVRASPAANEETEVKGVAQCQDDDGDAEELTQEIRSRQSSAVHTHVTLFEQLNVSSNFKPVLRDIRHIEPGGKTVANVSLFEQLEKNAKQKPVLDGVTQEFAVRNSRIVDRVMSFEGMEQTRRENATRSLDALKRSRQQQSERQRQGNKIPVAVSAYSM